MTAVRQATAVGTRSIIGSALQTSGNPAKSLQEHNSERQETGRATAPKGPHSPIPSVANDLAFALAKSGSASLARVLGRQFTSTNTPNTMEPTTHLHRMDSQKDPLTTNGTKVPKWYVGTNFCRGGVSL